MGPRNVIRRFEQLRSAAGMDWLHLHDLRHAFATFLRVLPAHARQAASAIDRLLGE
ncbi:hypothetical protein OG799_28635 [Micromonospora sp. NBC_00898]|uniref:hypothetical protein n=1 Tax=Micromonospora sp. NBC_00898 TaxID=2975981 RepID=UPI00386F0BC4|nr:hypothetical protein OG799_28635 [Micromonospora sp. NBC_00898]